MENQTPQEAIQAIETALEILAAKGYGEGGDVYDDLKRAIETLKPKWMKQAEKRIKEKVKA